MNTTNKTTSLSRQQSWTTTVPASCHQRRRSWEAAKQRRNETGDRMEKLAVCSVVDTHSSDFTTSANETMECLTNLCVQE